MLPPHLPPGCSRRPGGLTQEAGTAAGVNREFETCPVWVPIQDRGFAGIGRFLKRKGFHWFHHDPFCAMKVRNVSKVGSQSLTDKFNLLVPAHFSGFFSSPKRNFPRSPIFRCAGFRRHQRLDRPPLCLHTDVRVVLQHLLRDVAGQVPDGFISGLAALRQVGNESVPAVVPPSRYAGARLHGRPYGLECSGGAGGIGRLRFAKREDIPFRARFAELPRIPFGVLLQCSEHVRIERNRPALPGRRFAVSYRDNALKQIRPAPLQAAHLGISHSGMKSEHQRRIYRSGAPALCSGQQPGLLFQAEGARDPMARREVQHVAPAWSWLAARAMWRRPSCRPRPDSSGRLPGGITAATVVLPPRTSSRASSRPRLFTSSARAPPRPRSAPHPGPGPAAPRSWKRWWFFRRRSGPTGPPFPLVAPRKKHPPQPPGSRSACAVLSLPACFRSIRELSRRGSNCLTVERTGDPLGPSARDPWSRPWPAVFSATRGVILGRLQPESPILKTCLLGLLIACLCASAADLPKLPPETMGLIDQARSLPPEFSADTLLTLAASRVITERAWKLQIIEEASTAAAHAQLPHPFVW